MFHSSNNSRAGCTRFTKFLLLALVIGIQALAAFLPHRACAQDAIRSSLASEEAMEARKRAATSGRYNVKFANLALELGTRLNVEYNDNVFYYGDPIDDIIFRPQLTAAAVWLLTEQNRLSLSLGAGYAKYTFNPVLDTLLITPGSDLSFDVYVRDFVINFHDRFALRQDTSGQLNYGTNVAFLKYFENTLGVLVTWDLNKAVLAAGYDHFNHVSMTEEFNYQTRQSELFFGRALFGFNPVTWAGVEMGGGMTSYQESVLNNLTHLSTGGVLTYRSSQYLSLRLGAGYVSYVSASTTSTNIASNTSGLYVQLAVNHQLNRKISYSLSAGHELTPGWWANTLDLYYVRSRVGWNVIRHGSLGTSLSYERGTEEWPSVGEILSDRYGAGVDLNRTFSPKLSASFSYWFYYRDSSLQSQDYVQNRLALELRYRF